VATADFNGDGWLDIYVANDNHDNLLWMNQRDGTFRNTALLSGAALTAEGKAEASMGVDAGDYDNDGDEDLFITELTGEGSNLYVNDGAAVFEDQSARSGLGASSLPYTGFGAAWFDFDNDGWLDIMTANGTIAAIEMLRRAHDPFPFRQRKQLFRNLGNGRFEEVTGRAGAAFQLSEVGRGAAFGDIDNDGDVDVLVGNDAGPTRLLINNVGNRRHWLGLRLVGATKRDMYGARVAVFQNGRTLWRRARADGSYASANDPRVIVGLGDSTQAPKLRVVWASGRVEEWSTVPIDRYTTLIEGGGR
jgi:enediyne biosynthesis protein E4